MHIFREALVNGVRLAELVICEDDVASNVEKKRIAGRGPTQLALVAVGIAVPMSVAAAAIDAIAAIVGDDAVVVVDVAADESYDDDAAAVVDYTTKSDRTCVDVHDPSPSRNRLCQCDG